MADDKATRIMEAAERLMARRRYHEVTTDDIAREAKVGKGTIYRHFRDKDDLFHQAAVRGFDELCSLLKADLAPGEPVREQLLRACERIGGFFRGRRQWLGLAQAEDARMAMCRGRLKEQWRAHRLRLVAVVSELLTAGAEAGLVRRDLPPEMMAAMLLGMLRARARDLADVPEADRTYAMVVDLFLGGAAAPCDGDRK